MPVVQKQDRRLATLHSVRGEAPDTGACSLTHMELRLIVAVQELQAMNIAARLYATSTGRIRDV